MRSRVPQISRTGKGRAATAFSGETSSGLNLSGFCQSRQSRDHSGAEKRLAKKRIPVQACVVVTHFAQIGERILGDHAFDARFHGRGLQSDRRAHRDAERIQVQHVFARIERIGNRNGVVTFLPAVRRHIPAALPVRPRIHHHDTVVMAQENLGCAQDARAIVRNAVEEQHPIAIRRWRSNLPAAQFDAIRRAHIEIDLSSARAVEHGLCFHHAIGIEAHWMQHARANRACRGAQRLTQEQPRQRRYRQFGA